MSEIGTVVHGNNADLIAHVARLYAPEGTRIADLTYGKGVFWRKTPHLHSTLVGSDILTVPDRAWDFRDTPHDDESFDVAVLDPPYIHSPGRHVTDSRYRNAETTKAMLHKDIRHLYCAGMREALRIVRSDGGQIWVKCKDQVQSGLQRWAHCEMLADALSLGLIGRDLFVLVPSSTTPGGRWDVQHHARKRHSYLWVFERPQNRLRAQIDREGILDTMRG